MTLTGAALLAGIDPADLPRSSSERPVDPEAVRSAVLAPDGTRVLLVTGAAIGVLRTDGAGAPVVWC